MANRSWLVEQKAVEKVKNPHSFHSAMFTFKIWGYTWHCGLCTRKENRK